MEKGATTKVIMRARLTDETATIQRRSTLDWTMLIQHISLPQEQTLVTTRAYHDAVLSESWTHYGMNEKWVHAPHSLFQKSEDPPSSKRQKGKKSETVCLCQCSSEIKLEMKKPVTKEGIKSPLCILAYRYNMKIILFADAWTNTTRADKFKSEDGLGSPNMQL